MNRHPVPATHADLAEVPPLNFVSALDFVLMGTDLTMAFARLNDMNTFVILPTACGSAKGITVKEMIDDIQTLIKGYSPELTPTDLTSESVTGAIKDVNEASQTKESAADDNFNYDSIKINLNQAFLLLRTDQPTEYAFDISVTLDGLFPPDVSFINVKKFHLSIWNTKRAKILNQMNITDVDALLAEPTPA